MSVVLGEVLGEVVLERHGGFELVRQYRRGFLPGPNARLVPVGLSGGPETEVTFERIAVIPYEPMERPQEEPAPGEPEQLAA